MPPKKSKMPAFEMSAEQALFKERFLQLFAEPRDIKRRKPANEGKEIFSNWDAIFKEYFSKNPKSKINRANFDCLIDEVGFTIKDIGLIANGTQHNRYFLSVIEILVANIDALKELKRDVGFGVANIAVILKGSCGTSGGKIKVLKDNIRVFKALAANADEDTDILDEEGRPIKGIGFKPESISAIFIGSKDQMQSMLDQLALPRRLIGIKRLLSPEVGFVHANISNMLNRVGVNIGDAIDKLTSPEVIEGFKELRKIGFGRAGISGMISCPGFNAADAVENLFKIVNYHPFYKEKSTLRLAVKLIGINKDPIPVLNCLHDNFTNPRDVLEAIVVSKKYNGEKLSDYVPESLEEFLAEIAKNPDLLRKFEASDISSNEDERENSDISSGDEGEAEGLAMSDKMAPRGKRKGRFGYDAEESDIDILINTGEGANMSEFSVLEDKTISGSRDLSELERIELEYSVEPMSQFQIGEAAPLASKGKEISK